MLIAKEMHLNVLTLDSSIKDHHNSNDTHISNRLFRVITICAHTHYSEVSLSSDVPVRAWILLLCVYF